MRRFEVEKALNGIAVVLFSMAMLFLSCKDTYERVGEEAIKNIYPRGITEDFLLTYSETAEPVETEDVKSAKVVAVLTSPITENFENLTFPYRTFPKGLQIDFFDEKGQKSIIKADYGIMYSTTNLVDLRGNVVIETHDGKKLETSQLYWDRNNKWIFTQERFTYTNPEAGDMMRGMGMDFNEDFTVLNAHKTGDGYKIIKEELDD